MGSFLIHAVTFVAILAAIAFARWRGVQVGARRTRALFDLQNEQRKVAAHELDKEARGAVDSAGGDGDSIAEHLRRLRRLDPNR